MIEYALHDDILVAESDAKEFETLVREFIEAGSFERLDRDYNATLITALRTPEPFLYAGHRRPHNFAAVRDNRIGERTAVYRYVNVHTIPALQELDIAGIMARCADDALYTRINALVVRELQNFVTRVKAPMDRQIPVAGRRYCRAIRQFTSKNLGAYLFGLGACLPTLDEQGWRSLGTYQNVTGPLNTLTELWEVAEHVKSPDGLLSAMMNANPVLFEKLLKPYAVRAELCEFLLDAPYLPNCRRISKFSELSPYQAAL